jgi:hypothetical protein
MTVTIFFSFRAKAMNYFFLVSESFLVNIIDMPWSLTFISAYFLPFFLAKHTIYDFDISKSFSYIL